MNVNNISSVAFSARTKEGNRYEKSAEGKKYITALLVGGIATTAVIAKTSGLEDDAMKLVEKMSKQKINKNLFAATKSASLLTAALFAVPTGLLVGQVYDMFINHTRRKDADKLANTGIVSGNTNSGKITLGVIGAGTAALTANIINNLGKAIMDDLSKAKEELKSGKLKKQAAKTSLTELEDAEKFIEKYSKLPKYMYPAMLFVALFTGGAIYDHGVNKHRDELYDQKRNYMGFRPIY